jgi:hypothetical protein
MMHLLKRRNKIMAGKHPGFQKSASSIARKQGISKEAASAILASGARHSSASAKKKNPRLKRVMKKKG